MHRLGYRIPDLTWLKWRELEYLWGDDEELTIGPADSDAAFTL